MADKDAAERLRRVLKVAMAEAGIEDWIALARHASVSPTTLDNWIYGRTTPRARELARVANVLRPHTSQAKLEAAYFDLVPEEPPLIDALREMIPELHELVLLLRAQADEAVLAAVRDALGERRRERAGPQPEQPDTEPQAPDHPSPTSLDRGQGSRE